MLKEFLDENIDEINKEPVTVIQMGAAWCAPCKSLREVMTILSEEYKDRANFYYGDVEEGAINAASQAGIRAVPSTLVWKKSVEVDRLIGSPGEAEVRKFLEKNL